MAYGKTEDEGIRCCYHGWLFSTNGEILETPGEDVDSKQAKKLSKNFLQLNEIEIVYVSSLTRTIQTAESIFIDREKIKIIALDKIKEFPQGKEICNKRRSKSVLKSK